MSVLDFLSSFLIFLIVLTSSINGSTLDQTDATVTDAVIRGICYRTTNPNLCLRNLRYLKGAQLFRKPLVVLGTRPVHIARSYGNATSRMLWDHYRGISTQKSQLRSSYHKCVLNYVDAIKQLDKARGFIKSGQATAVKKLALLAVNYVNSCDRELNKSPPTLLEYNRRFFKANKEFKDLCDIIVEVCNKVVELVV